MIVAYGEQSQNIAQGVDEGKGLDLDQGAGDQGLMFGYACDETPQLMPLPSTFRTAWSSASPKLRRDGRLPWLRPDAKSQVTIRYVDGKPDSIDTVVLSTQHAPGMKHKQIEEAVIEQIIKPVLPKQLVKGKIKYLVNPTGSFEIGGPKGDCGLTGRKIIVDTYGGSAPHGGGAFSGKDPSKVDRSAAYAARYVAKNVVAAGLATQVPGPGVLRHRRRAPDQRHGHDASAPARYPTKNSRNWCRSTSTCGPRASSRCSTLLRPIYEKTAAYGHFGRDEPEFTWEATDKARALAADAGVKQTAPA